MQMILCLENIRLQRIADYTFAKNIVGQVEWYDLESKEGSHDAETTWSQLLFTI